MAPKKKSSRGNVKKKARIRIRQTRPTRAHAGLRKSESRKALPVNPIHPLEEVGKPVRESVRLTIESIRGETAIGDLLVAFPRTREILARNGLRLEAEDAGDIYMTLDAFSALNGLRTENLLHDLVDIAKEPPLQQTVPQLATPPL